MTNGYFLSHSNQGRVYKLKKNYSTIEKETLAIVFACSKFHEYIYGRQFVVESDHKSLKNIFWIHKTPPRIEIFIML